MKDGDLWEHTHKMVEAKGPKSVSYKKVKGHATEEMVASGKATREDKEGNDEADSAADRGSNNEQSSLYTLTKMLAARHARLAATVPLAARTAKVAVSLAFAK